MCSQWSTRRSLLRPGSQKIILNMARGRVRQIFAREIGPRFPTILRVVSESLKLGFMEKV